MRKVGIPLCRVRSGDDSSVQVQLRGGTGGTSVRWGRHAEIPARREGRPMLLEWLQRWNEDSVVSDAIER